jgi:hypothetical protein
MPPFASNLWDKGVALWAKENVREACSILAILALTGVMLFPALRGDWPAGQDHPAHLFRIWQLKQTLLHDHTLWTWSHRWFVGYPTVVYPIGADLFVLAVQAISLGTLDIGPAYGLAIFLFYFLYGYAAFFFIRRATASRVTALIAVLFLLTDAGNNDIGGWFWLINIGVWTAGLGAVPALIGTVLMSRLLEKPAARTVAAVALCFGLAVLCHPLYLVYFAVATPLLCASRYLAGEETRWRGALLYLAGGVVLGLLLASIWLVPFFSAFAYVSDVGQITDISSITLAQVAQEIPAGTLFPRMHPLAAAFGFVGSIVLLRARRTLALFMALFVFVTIALSTSTLTGLFGSGIQHWISPRVIPLRLLLLVKPFWYGAAAFLLVASWRALDPLHRPQRGTEATARSNLRRRIARAVFISVCVGPFVFYALISFIQQEVLRPAYWNSQRPDLAARKEFVAWAKDHWSQQFGFFRIVHGFDKDAHQLTDLGMELPFPFYKLYRTPSGHFKYKLGSDSTATFRAANVRFALALHPLVERADLRLIKIFDQRLNLYEFRDWNPDPFEVQGDGMVKLREFRDEDIVLQAEPGARGLLRLNVAYFPKWQATRDGMPVAITPVSPPAIERSLFMQVELLPGTYHFRYRKTATDYVGAFLTLMGATGCLLLAGSGKFLARRRSN